MAKFNSKNTSNNSSSQTFFQRERQPLARAAQNTINRARAADLNLVEINRLARELQGVLERAIAATEQENGTDVGNQNQAIRPAKTN